MTYIYAGIAIVGALIGGFLCHLYDGGRYSVLELQFANYKSAAAIQQANAQALANTILQKQAADAQRIAKENDDALSDLHQKLAAADTARAHDRASFAGLLHAAAQASCGGAVPKAPDQPGAPAAGPASGIDALGSACESLAHEDRDNADALDALTKQVRGNQ